MAAMAHRDQVRKGSQVPYIIHPTHAAMILLRYQFPEDAVIAAVLHDVVEDTDTSLAKIEAEFGSKVAQTVDQVSEKKSAGGGEKLPWRQRKQEQLERLGQADMLAAAVNPESGTAFQIRPHCAAVLASIGSASRARPRARADPIRRGMK